jgi:DNA helicase-2/ATP-dependent DNA helicase PcrA
MRLLGMHVLTDLTAMNPPQREAVEHVAGPLLVFAGAGSGKTRVITLRAARLVLEHGVEPQRILLVTFTNKAANEMKQRLGVLLGDARVKRMWVGTFHATCARMLRAHADAVGRRRDFVIYDDDDQLTVMKQIFGELKIDKKMVSPSKMLQRIQDAKQKGYAPGDIPLLDPDTAQFVEVWERYDVWLRACNAMDFEDLILLTMRLAEGSHPAIGTMLRTAFDHVLVDEFQDTNFTQYRLVKALARASNNLCVVGDDDQCIYTWRGADPSNIRDFQTEWPSAKVVRLEQNYRSTKRIVACAVGVIEQNRLRVPKTLWTDNPAGGEVEVIESPSDRGEASAVCSAIRAHVAAGGRTRDCAILYRGHAQSRVIEDQLRDSQVPYRIVGGHRFYDRREVKDVLGYLRLLCNPASDVDLLRVLNVPARGLGASTLKRLSEIAGSRKVSLWDALPIAAQAPEIRRTEQLQLGAFRDVVEQFQKTMKSERPSVLCARLIEGIGYKKMLQALAKKLKEDGKNAEALAEEARIENLDEIVNAIASYEKRASDEGDVPSLRGYLEMVSLVAEDSKDEHADRVLLMTVHASKGLEFEVVFIVGFEEGRFPVRNVDMNPRELEEERRIAYVAITRAKTRLVVSMARLRWVHGEVQNCTPSRFLQDMRGGGGAPRRAPDKPAPPKNNKDGWL